MQKSAAPAEARAGWCSTLMLWALVVVLSGMSGCALPPQPVASAPPVAAAAPPPPAPPPAPVPFDQAVQRAATAVLQASEGAVGAGGAGGAGGERVIVIDPLVNGVTGEQTAATQSIGERISALTHERFPQFTVAPFTAATVGRAPLVMVGTFTPVNAANQPAGDREAYRFCLVMADLATGRIAAKSVARAELDEVDPTPTAFFRDSPAWSDDASVKAYIDTCQASKVGDPINPVFAQGIVAGAIISDAIDAYNDGKYADALALYRNALTNPAGRQLRVFNGIYLATARLGNRAASASAFGDLVDYGLDNNRLAVKFLFRPGSTSFVGTGTVGGDYAMWLREIASHEADRGGCLTVVGNTSRTGSPAINQQLSIARAEMVRARLEQAAPALQGRVIAEGAGDRFPLVGTGADDATDALDRRVDLKPQASCS